MRLWQREMAAEIQPRDLPDLAAEAHGLRQPIGVVGLPCRGIAGLGTADVHAADTTPGWVPEP